MVPSRSPGNRRENEFHQQLSQRVDGKPKLWRKLQVRKSTALGLVVPFANLQLEVRHVDPTDQDLGSAYLTSKLHWEECMITNLPKFDLYHAQDTTLSGVRGELADPVAKVSRPLWNSIRSMLARFEMMKIDGWLSFDNELPADIRSHWKLHQKGLNRHYELLGADSSKEHPEDINNTRFVWKGSRSILDHLEDSKPLCNGNLKLLGEDGIPLAAWKQQRDSKVLGSIHIFEAARDVIPTEVVLVSCLCIVIVEKCTGVTWFGGM